MRFRTRLAMLGVRQSMTRGGAPRDNAHMESFFHSLKADAIHGRSFDTVAALRHELGRYVRYYNLGACIRRSAVNRPLTMRMEPA